MSKRFKAIILDVHRPQDIYNDSVDVYVVLPNKTIYIPTFVTIAYMKDYMEWMKYSCFAGREIVVVQDLRNSTIKAAISKLIEDGNLNRVSKKYGTIHTIFRYENYKSYADVKDSLEEN